MLFLAGFVESSSSHRLDCHPCLHSPRPGSVQALPAVVKWSVVASLALLFVLSSVDCDAVPGSAAHTAHSTLCSFHTQRPEATQASDWGDQLLNWLKWLMWLVDWTCKSGSSRIRLVPWSIVALSTRYWHRSRSRNELNCWLDSNVEKEISRTCCVLRSIGKDGLHRPRSNVDRVDLTRW